MTITTVNKDKDNKENETKNNRPTNAPTKIKKQQSTKKTTRITVANSNKDCNKQRKLIPQYEVKYWT